MLNAGDILRAKGLWYGASYVAAVVWCLFVPVACMTPDKAVEESDETGTRLATDYWRMQTGSTNDFNVHRPADTLTLRIALLAAARGEQNVIFPKIPNVTDVGTSNAVLCLSLTDALRVAARNDRRYQKLKEDVFLRALELDYQQYAFETSFSGMMLALLSGDPGIRKASESTEAGFTRRLPDGTDLVGRLALDVVSLLRDDWRSVALSGDLTVTVPLMRGAGREIVREPLTQAERNLVSAIHAYQHYRQTYAVSVANGYFTVLQLEQQFKNALENERRLNENSRRAEMWFEAGRMQRIQVDQARTDLLKAGESVIATRKNFNAQMDAFKMAIGLPPEGNVTLDSDQLYRLEMQKESMAQTNMSAINDFPDEKEACRIALAERHDLYIVRSQLEDTARGVKIAADALRADVALTGGLTMDRMRVTGDGSFDGEETLSGGLRAGFPWDRRKERNAFKRQLIALEQTKREVEAQEDNVKLTVRNGLRNLVAARASYKNQVEAMKVAKLRVESNNLFLQSGRSSMRDILEAESALLSARNALCAAVIEWHMSDLELRRDMGVLEISETGVWRDANGENHG